MCVCVCVLITSRQCSTELTGVTTHGGCAGNTPYPTQVVFSIINALVGRSRAEQCLPPPTHRHACPPRPTQVYPRQIFNAFPAVNFKGVELFEQPEHGDEVHTLTPAHARMAVGVVACPWHVRTYTCTPTQACINAHTLTPAHTHSHAEHRHARHPLRRAIRRSPGLGRRNHSAHAAAVHRPPVLSPRAVPGPARSGSH